jgi:holdfast attachment protein HfaA
VAGGAASAQTLTTSAASFNAGYGRAAGQENQGTNFASGGSTLGVETTTTWTQGATTLVLTGAGASSAAGFSPGSGFASLGPGFSIITRSGSTTTVINLGGAALASASASSSAATELNGTIDLDGPH